MKKTQLLVLAAVLLIVTPTKGRNDREKIEENKILEYISDLASDEMEGRKSGEPSGRRAEEWLARTFHDLGLEPGGDNGTYFQEFIYPMMRFENMGAVRLVDSERQRDYTYGDDYYFYVVTSPGHVRAEVVFVGYGISRPDLGLDEYQNLDVEGKILLCLSGYPGKEKEKWGRDWTDYAKADQAQKRNALGLLIFDPGQKEEKLPRYRIWSFNLKYQKKGLLFGQVGPRIVADLFESTEKSLGALQQKIADELKPQSFSTGKTLELEVEALIDGQRKAANIIGKITGVHPELKDEVIIVSGHYDGGGTDPDGVIYNGANDNASGIGVLLEIARIMKANQIRPARSILFIGWGAEEQGAYGSKYFIENPLVPLDKITSAFILDCVGLGEGEFWLFGAGHFTPVFDEIKTNIPVNLLEGFHPRKEAGSDQYFFQQKEIPSFFAHNIREISFGHTPEDDVEALNPNTLRKCALLIYEASIFSANRSNEER